MHIEVRTRGKKKLYYLAHSFRDNGKVKKVRRYLGSDLTAKKIKYLKKNAEAAIINHIKEYMKIRDPLHTVISESEKKAIDSLTKGNIPVKHLSANEWKRFIESFTYDTNAIEGSTVTAIEVKKIINNDEWPGKRSKWEISETYGVADAVEYIRKTKEHISLGLIRKLHRIVFKNSKEFAGKTREPGIEVSVIDSRGFVIHRGAPQRQIAGLLNELIGWYNTNKKAYHPILLAAVVHNQFENIHPFQDGNGRVGRLLLNNILIKHNLPPVNIKLKNRGDYYYTLQEYEKRGNIRPTIELIINEYKELKKTPNM